MNKSDSYDLYGFNFTNQDFEEIDSETSNFSGDLEMEEHLSDEMELEKSQEVNPALEKDSYCFFINLYSRNVLSDGKKVPMEDEKEKEEEEDQLKEMYVEEKLDIVEEKLDIGDYIDVAPSQLSSPIITKPSLTPQQQREKEKKAKVLSIIQKLMTDSDGRNWNEGL